jgi:hypothetical protein
MAAGILHVSAKVRTLGLMVRPSCRRHYIENGFSVEIVIFRAIAPGDSNYV